MFKKGNRNRKFFLLNQHYKNNTDMNLLRLNAASQQTCTRLADGRYSHKNAGIYSLFDNKKANTPENVFALIKTAALNKMSNRSKSILMMPQAAT